MSSDTDTIDSRSAYRDVVGLALDGPEPAGEHFDACRQVLRSGREPELEFQAICSLLEGLLAVPTLNLDHTRCLVHLLKDLARGTIEAGDLL